MSRVSKSIAFACALLALAGCAHYPVNARLTQYNPDAGYRYKTLSKGEKNSDSLLVVLAFSGGGHRAAALSYGVLEELARTDIVWEGQHKRLLDEVDMISAVSGGSFTAAYYALFGDDIFRDYEKKFLKQNIQLQLYWRLLSPVNWCRLASPYFDRNDMAAEFYDRHVFDRKTFGDLLQGHRRPFVILNATDMSSGARFDFTQDQFDLIGSDISTFPVSRAVAASSASPVILTPITNNYAGSGGYIEPPQVETILAQGERLPRGFAKAREMRAYQDATNHPYLHLLDGALSDDLGLRGPLEPVLALGGVRPAFQHFGLKPPRKIVVIAVNAAVRRDFGWDKHAQSPGLLQTSLATGDVIERYSFETRQLLHDSVRQWERELNEARTGAERVKVYGIEVSFDQLADPKEREYFNHLPTRFSLPPGAVDRLREVAGQLLRESPGYRELLHDLTQGKEQT